MRSIVRALAGDSTMTSVFAMDAETKFPPRFRSIFTGRIASYGVDAPPGTLARSVKSHESTPGSSANEPGEFELTQTGQERRSRQPGTLSDRVDIARFARDQTRQNGVAVRRRNPGDCGRWPGLRTNRQPQ